MMMPFDSANFLNSIPFENYVAGGVGVIEGIFGLAASILMLIGTWKIYEKAGEAGWKSLIPFYNYYILLKITAQPTWWFWAMTGGIIGGYLLLALALVNPILALIGMLIIVVVATASLVMTVLVCVNLSKAFGKGLGTTFGLFFLPFVFIIILGLGDAKYNKAKLKK